MSIEISNPRADGAKYTSARRALEFVVRGIAVWLPDGRLRFKDSVRAEFQLAEAQRIMCEELEEFIRHRGERVYWNGARNYPGAAYPPGCNVSFPKNGSEEAAERYCS